jgi:hypothetical protein
LTLLKANIKIADGSEKEMLNGEIHPQNTVVENKACTDQKRNMDLDPDPQHFARTK